MVHNPEIKWSIISDPQITQMLVLANEDSYMTILTSSEFIGKDGYDNWTYQI